MLVLCELAIKDFPTFLILHSSITVLDISMECIIFHIAATVSAEILWLPRPTLDLSSANTFLWLIDRVYDSGEVIFPRRWFFTALFLSNATTGRSLNSSLSTSEPMIGLFELWDVIPYPT